MNHILKQSGSVNMTCNILVTLSKKLMMIPSCGTVGETCCTFITKSENTVFHVQPSLAAKEREGRIGHVLRFRKKENDKM